MRGQKCFDVILAKSDNIDINFAADGISAAKPVIKFHVRYQAVFSVAALLFLIGLQSVAFVSVALPPSHLHGNKPTTISKLFS